MDHDSGETKTYECEEDAVKDGLCIFHHPEYWREHKDEVRKRFMEKVEDAVNNKKSLFCIGYNLPEINLFNKKFEAPVYFTKAIFHEADFIGAEFSSVADFSGAKFYYANFVYATFSDAVVFDKVKFGERVHFDYTTFSGAVSFVYSDFSPDVLEKSLDPYNRISFRHANFERQERVVFDSCNMERVSFICTDLERIKFRNVKWKNFKIYDEKIFLLKRSKEARGKSDKEKEEILVNAVVGEDLTLDNVLAVYSALRENYDYCLRYDESGKFFVNEMRLKKRFSNPVEKIIMSAYELLCLYGESYTRTIIWILATISLFALARLYMNAPIDSLDSLKISTAAFFQLYYNSDLLTFTERLISIPILGSLYISLKRKLERRIRH